MEEGGSGMEGQIDNHGGKGERRGRKSGRRKGGGGEEGGREGATEFSSSSCLISDVSLRP